MSDVYLVMNETTFIGTDQISTEVVQVSESLQGALDFLADLAYNEGVDDTYDESAHSLYIPPKAGIETDEYYIQEMELKP